MTNTTALPAAPLAFPPFRPSPAQRRLLEFIHESPSFQTMQQLCEGAQVPRRTYYSWCQNPGFRLWLATSWSARLLTDGVMLLNIGRVQSTRSYPYWKALFDLTFDPKGLGYLQQWQQNLANANNDSFQPSDEPAPAPPAATPHPPAEDPQGTAVVQSTPQPDQQLSATSCSHSPLSTPRPAATLRLYPHHIARRFHPFSRPRRSTTFRPRSRRVHR